MVSFRSRIRLAALALAVALPAGAGPASAVTITRGPTELENAYSALRSGNGDLDDARLVSLAAAHGDPDAAEVLAWLFATGKVIRQDEARAVDWYLRAHSLGIPKALTNARAVYAAMTPAERARLDPRTVEYMRRATPTVAEAGPRVWRPGERGLGPGPRATAALPADRLAVATMVEQVAAASRVPPSLAKAVAKVESNFRPDAVSSAGARGVMQIMPSTAQGEFGVGSDALWDARNNITLGVRYLESLIDRYGAVDIALSHYNGGSAVGQPGQARVIPYTRGYVDAVLAWERIYAGRAAGEPSPLPIADPGTSASGAPPVAPQAAPKPASPPKSRVKILRGTAAS